MTSPATPDPPGADHPTDVKSPEAFRTIGEVALDLDLPQHVLRFWETKFSQIRPVKRGGNRRFYRPDDVELLQGIRRLLYGQGYTIRGVQRILRERGMRFVQAVGRGEQVAPAAFTDAEPEPESAPRLSRADRAALSSALRELKACRDRLGELRARENEDGTAKEPDAGPGG